MSRAETVRRLLRRYGVEARCEQAQGHVLLRPQRPEDPQGRLYLCTCPASFCPDIGQQVQAQGQQFTVLRAESCFAQAECVYHLVVLELNEGRGANE